MKNDKTKVLDKEMNAKSTHVDNRTITNPKKIEAKLNRMPTRKDLCSRSESSNVFNASLLEESKETFVSKNINALETNLLCAITNSTNHQVNVPCTPIIISKNNNDARVTNNDIQFHLENIISI